MDSSNKASPEKAAFDSYSESYSQVVEEALAFGGQEHAFYLQFKARLILELLRAEFADLSALSVLDFGCGTGGISGCLASALPGLQGTDISEASLETARRQVPGVVFSAGKADCLPYPDNAFDAAFAVCVFHHIDPYAREKSVAELVRILKPGGMLIIMEHNPWNPGTRLVVNRCELDRDAVLLSGPDSRRMLATSRALSVRASGYFLFFPWDNRITRLIEHVIRPLPFGAQYFVTAQKGAHGSQTVRSKT